MIIAEDIEGEVLTTHSQQAKRNIICVGVKAPAGDRQEMLKDIAILTGGEVITDELGLDLKETTINSRAGQVVVQKENTIIVSGQGDSEAIKNRIAQIKSG